MIATLRRDAVELARCLTGDVSRRSVLKVAMSQDTYLITTLHRLRVRARAWRIPLVNTLLRRVQSTVFGIEIGNDVVLAEGVCFLHTHGIVLGGDARIGARVRFYGSNTVGTASDNGYPVLEDDVQVGAGARILGPVRIGARARIGANAVVLQDVPADAVAVGVPARIVKPRAARSLELSR